MIGVQFKKLTFFLYLISFEDDVPNLCLVLACWEAADDEWVSPVTKVYYFSKEVALPQSTIACVILRRVKVGQITFNSIFLYLDFILNTTIYFRVRRWTILFQYSFFISKKGNHYTHVQHTTLHIESSNIRKRSAEKHCEGRARNSW